MNKRNSNMKISLFIAGSGHHISSWRSPESTPEKTLNFDYYKNIARKAEDGKFDFVFLADGLYIDENSHPNILGCLEPITLLSALATCTDKIGLAATASTTYSEPYNIARQLASLDHLSDGRAAWNIVTTADDKSSMNFSRDKHLDHEKRYAKGDEFVRVVKGLWDSWRDGALVKNKANGVFLDSDKLTELNHKGDFFSVKGPLNVPNSPQRHPVLIQAGSSETGKNFAAKHAEVVFTNQKDFDGAREFYDSVKHKVLEAGRLEDEVIIMPGLAPILANTKSEAEQRKEHLEELITPERGLKTISSILGGMDLGVYSLKEPLPYLQVEDSSIQQRIEALLHIANEYNYSLGELAQHMASRNGHNTFVGTPEELAEKMIYWFENGAADAFNIMPTVLAEDLNIFVDEVVPILQNRGYVKCEYSHSTLRGHLELE